MKIGKKSVLLMREKSVMRLLSVVACLLLLALAAFGQGDNGSITGTVKDTSGAVAPNASIDAKNVDTNTVFHGGTSATGNYVIPVPAGKYELTVTVTGFKKYVRENLEVQVATATRQDVTLELGATNETITVTDVAPLLNTETGEISHTMNTDDVDQLPVLTIQGGSWYGSTTYGNIRNPLQELILLPGTNFANDQALVVNGLPSNSETIRIEGQDSTSTIWKVEQQNSQGGVDAIQEVAVQTSNFAAEYGQAAGGYLNYTMKSGTNQLHGSAYDFWVNEALNAGLPFTNAGLTNSLKDGQQIRNESRKNDYGFTIGGPVVLPKLYNGKNKTFFFVNFEQYRQNISTAGSITTVPSAAWRGSPAAGANFQTGECNGYTNGVCTPGFGVLNTNTFGPVVDPAGNTIGYGEIFNPTTTRLVDGQEVRTPFPNNTIPYSMLDPAALAIQALMPMPNIAGGGTVNNYTIPTYTGYQHTTNVSVKMDQSLSSTIKISGYYSQLQTYNPNTNGFSGSDLALGGAIPTNNWNHTIRLNYDETISPTLLLHIGVGFFDTSEPEVPPSYNESSLGINGYYNENQFPSIGGLTNYLNGGWVPGGGAVGPAFTAIIWEQKPTANTSLTWIRGNHTFKAGGEYVQEGYPDRSLWRANGTFAFSNAETSDPYQNTVPLLFGDTYASGNNYASFLMGLPDSMQLNPATDTRLGYHSMGFFVQDSWKVSRKFTLDYGLRYDFETYMNEEHGRMQDASFVTPNANAGGLDGAVIYEATCGCSFSHNYPFAFGPRLGGAYQIDSKTVIRGGAGIQYDAAEAPNGISYSTADYFTLNPTSYGISPLTNYGGLSGGNPYAIGNPYGNAPITWPNFNESKYPIDNGGLYAPLNPFIFFDPHNRPGRIFTWSIGVQREVIHNLLVEVSYVGNRGAYFPAPSADQMTCDCLTPQLLQSQFGLNINNPATQALLTSPISSPAVQAAFPQFKIVDVNGVGTVPSVYPGFPASQPLVQALRPVPQWSGNLLPWLGPPMGDTWYDSMQVKVTKRFSHGLQAQGNYTWAKGLVNGASSDSTYFLPGAVGINDVYNFPQNKQLNQYVAPQSMVITFTYTTPKFSGADTGMKILSQLARDWQIGAVLRYQSGQLIAVPTSGNNLGAELGRSTSTFENIVPGQPLLLVNPNCGCFNPQTAQVLNPAAFVNPTGGQWGTSAPYYDYYRWQRQPGESMSLGRNFRIGKEGKDVLQIRAEFYNVFNRLFLSMPSTTNPQAAITVENGINTAGYGTIATVNGAGAQPRNGQLVARFQF